MNIQIKHIILEATRLDKVANNHIKNNEPDKALKLYEKQNSSFNRNFHNINKDDRSFDLYNNTTNMAGALANYDKRPNPIKIELIKAYKNNSRRIKNFGLNKAFEKPNNIIKLNSEGYIGPSNITRVGNNIKNVPFIHGGGKYFLEDFLKNKSAGYSLENNSGNGIQVHPYPAINSRSNRSYIGYPQNAVNLYGDRPAVLTGKINGQYLTGAPVKEEAGIKNYNAAYIKNPKIEELPIRQFADKYKTNAINYAISNNIPIEHFLNNILPNNKDLRKQLRG